MVADPHKFGRDPVRRQHEIHAVGGHRGLWHGGESRRVLVLRKGHAPGGFDGLHAGRTVRARTGEDHADGPAAALLGQRPQEAVDGHVGSRGLHAWTKPERPLRDGEIDVGWNHVHVIGFHRHIVGHLAHRHGGGAGENLRQQAVVFGVEMLHENDGQAGIGRQIGQQMFENFQPAGGAANAGHWDGGLAFDHRFGISF